MDNNGPKATTDFVEIPDFKWPTISIGIESVYGWGGERGPLTSINFDREDGEDNEALAKRIASKMEQFILEVLNDNEENREHFEKRQAEKK